MRPLPRVRKSIGLSGLATAVLIGLLAWSAFLPGYPAASTGCPGYDGRSCNTHHPHNPPCDADHGHPLQNLTRIGKPCPPGKVDSSNASGPIPSTISHSLATLSSPSRRVAANAVPHPSAKRSVPQQLSSDPSQNDSGTCRDGSTPPAPLRQLGQALPAPLGGPTGLLTIASCAL